MTRTKALVNNLLMSNLQWNRNLDKKSHTIEIVILNTKWTANPAKICVQKTLTYVKKFYIHKIDAVNLSKIYFLKNTKKTCTSNNRDLNRNWTTKSARQVLFHKNHRNSSFLFVQIRPQWVDFVFCISACFFFFFIQSAHIYCFWNFLHVSFPYYWKFHFILLFFFFWYDQFYSKLLLLCF